MGVVCFSALVAPFAVDGVGIRKTEDVATFGVVVGVKVGADTQAGAVAMGGSAIRV